MAKCFLLPVIMLSLASLSAATLEPLSRYRDVTLGDSVATVIERLQLAPTDVKVLYEMPSLVQEVTWRPQRFVSGSIVTRDPLSEMVLTFYMDRLTRIVAAYDRDRTQGLTDADLQELLGNVYGLPILRSVDTQSVAPSIAARHTVAQWADVDAGLLLWREDYPRRIGLTITASDGEAQLQAAIVEGARLRAEGAVGRERDKVAATAAANKERDAKIRLENKAKFKP